MRRAVLLLIIGGCGRIGFSPISQTDAADGPAPDAVAPFSTPVMLTMLSSAFEDDDPTLTDDELEIYFSSDRPGSQASDIWRSLRASTSDPWAAPMNVAQLNTAADEQTPELSADGLTMFLARDTSSSTMIDIFVSTRATRNQPWSTPVLVAELASGSDDFAPATSPDQLAMVFTRGAVTVDAKLFLTTRTSTTAAWGTPVAIVDAPGELENQAWLGDASIYYTINVGAAEQRIARAARTAPGSFAAPQTIPEIDLPGSESDPWLSVSERAIYFEHEDDLYMATR
ncbi:MAG TPA: hypothetical protein VMZ53_08820 [Kofleriaceae bacterium]|nr:hypothetical protein [Kofleriaceae bacterium]